VEHRTDQGKRRRYALGHQSKESYVVKGALLLGAGFTLGYAKAMLDVPDIRGDVAVLKDNIVLLYDLLREDISQKEAVKADVEALAADAAEPVVESDDETEGQGEST
jgi:hypothetical protein